MKIVKTDPLKPGRQRFPPTVFNNYFKLSQTPSTVPGLKTRYSLVDAPGLDDKDCLEFSHFNTFYPNGYGGGNGYGEKDEVREFSAEDVEITRKYFNDQLLLKPSIVIVEIGVCRNPYNETSTSIFIDNKRQEDVYIGIDIENKTFLDNHEKGVYTIQQQSEDVENITQKINEIIGENRTIDVFMIDGKHSINQVYKEWEYTSRLSKDGVVIFHDTNRHPGPYFVLQSIDTEMYDVYKYFADVRDFGLGVAVRKGV
jgi:hypothetical protein